MPAQHRHYSTLNQSWRFPSAIVWHCSKARQHQSLDKSVLMRWSGESRRQCERVLSVWQHTRLIGLAANYDFKKCISTSRNAYAILACDGPESIEESSFSSSSSQSVSAHNLELQCIWIDLSSAGWAFACSCSALLFIFQSGLPPRAVLSLWIWIVRWFAWRWRYRH